MLASVIFCRQNASLLFFTSLKFLPENLTACFIRVYTVTYQFFCTSSGWVCIIPRRMVVQRLERNKNEFFSFNKGALRNRTARLKNIFTLFMLHKVIIHLKNLTKKTPVSEQMHEQVDILKLECIHQKSTAQRLHLLQKIFENWQFKTCSLNQQQLLLKHYYKR